MKNTNKESDNGLSIKPVGNGDYNLVNNGVAILTVGSFKEAKLRQIRAINRKLFGGVK